jgi:hypothetical protein
MVGGKPHIQHGTFDPNKRSGSPYKWEEPVEAPPRGQDSGWSFPDEGNEEAPAEGEAVRVKGVEEAMALEPGTVFITPDGRRKVRP